MPFSAFMKASLLLPLLALGASALQAAPAFSLSDEGVKIDMKGMGEFALSYPMLRHGDKDYKGEGPVDRKISGTHADLKYAGGGSLSLDIGKDGEISISFDSIPSGVSSFHVETLIGIQFADGGSWSAGGSAPKEFPREKSPKPFLYQGNSSSFVFSDPAGRTLSIALPPYAFQQLADNREWNWNTFHWLAILPLSPENAKFQFVIKDAPSPAGKALAFLVDKFGQSATKSFPGKVSADSELKADADSEAAYYASLKPLELDSFGGLPGSGAKLGLKATGFFHVEKSGSKWLLADPEGNAFFHLGICSFGFNEDYTYVNDRREIFEWLPSTAGEYASAWHPDKYWHDSAVSFYITNLVRKYGPSFEKDKHIRAMVDRVRRMGFNSIGAFSGSPVFKEAHIPYVSGLPLENWVFAPDLPGMRGIFDPFEESNAAKMDSLFAEKVAPSASEPLLIGYFLANEQGFEDVPRAAPQLPGKHAAKRKLVETLKAAYGNDIAAFDAAWGLDAKDFDSLLDRGLPVSTKQAFEDMNRFTGIFLEAYYSLIVSTFRKYDKNHLLIGNRWQPGTANNEQLCRIAGKYMDVISVNYYTVGVDSAFMKRIYEWSEGKPQMWSEFFYTSSAESNVGGHGGDMATQKARGEAYRNYVEAAASLGFVVGIEWFTLVDQAVSGRWFEKANGERANSGVFNVCDRPYRDLVEGMLAANNEVYSVLLDGKEPFHIDDPRFSASGAGAKRQYSAGRPLSPVKIDCLSDSFPIRPPERIGASRLVQGRDADGFEASFKLCWDESFLYVLAEVRDPSPMFNSKEGGDLWNGDGLELFIGSESLDQPGPLLFSDRQIFLAARKSGNGPSFHVVRAAEQPEIKTLSFPSVDGKGYVIEAAIPWPAIGISPKEGQELLFDVAVDDAPEGGDRIRQLMWSGTARNSSDRSAWGRLRLVP